MKKIRNISMLSVAVLLLTISSVFAAPINSNVNIITINNNIPLEETGQLGRVAWDQGVIQAIGTGFPPENGRMSSQNSHLARRAAIVEAYRNLAETIQGVQVDSETTMLNLAIASDVVKTKVSGIIKGAKIVSEKALSDGSYIVVMSVNLYGDNSVAAVAFDAIRPPQIQEFPRTVMGSNYVQPTAHYTGVIVDARGLGLESTFSPRVYDQNGRIIYGNMYINTEFAISQGMVEYTLNPEMVQAAERGQSRAGSYPLIVKALQVKDNNNNVVISNEDGNAILAYNESNGFLKQCAVVFER